MSSGIILKIRIQKLKAIAFLALTLPASFAMPAHAEASILLQACNALTDTEQRLKCLMELMQKSSPNNESNVALVDLKRRFSETFASIEVGISYQQYAQISLEPARALAAYKVSAASLAPKGVALLELSVQALSDAQRLWHAQIFKSKDGGIFLGGDVVIIAGSGVGDILERYNLAARDVKWINTLSLVPAVWQRAKKYMDDGLFALENPTQFDQSDINPSIPRSTYEKKTYD